MSYIHDKKKDGKKVNLDKGLNIEKDETKRAVANNYVIDINKRAIKDKVNKEEPKFTK